jgi:O-antigen/teichoic acid export membrane protein
VRQVIRAHAPRLDIGERGSLASAAALVFFGNLLARALAFLFPVVVARIVDRSDFATVYFFIAVGFFASQLVMTGYPTAMTRYVAAEQQPETRGQWVASALFGGVALLAVSITAGEALARAAGAAPLLMSVVVVGVTIDAFYFSFLRGLQKFKLLVLYRVGANFAQILVLLGAYALGIANVTTIVVIYSFIYLIPIAIIELLQRPVRDVMTNAARATVRSIALLTRFALPSLISGIAWGTLLGLDVFFVRLFAPEELADYSAARVLTVPMLLVPFAIDVVLLPRVAAASSTVEQWRLLRQALAAAGGVALIAAAVYAVAADLVVDIVFPPSYAAAADVLPLLAVALGLLGIYSVLSDWWMGTGRPLPPAISLTLGAMVAVAAHLFLTRQSAGVGAALSITVGTVVALVLLGAQTLRASAAAGSQPVVAGR